MSNQPKRMKDDENPYKKMRRNYEEASKDYKPKSNSNSKNNKSIDKLSVVFKVIALVFVIITIVFYVSILKLNLLPSSYITIFTIAVVVFTMLMVIGLGKKHKTRKLNIFCLVIVLLVSGVYLYIANYANATSEFLGSMFQEVQETDEYYVVVRKDSSYDSIEDIDGEDVYIFQVEEDVQAELTKEVEVTFDTQESLTDLGNNLLDQEIDIVFISASQYSMLSEEIENFADETKIIYTATHEVESTEDIKSQ